MNLTKLNKTRKQKTATLIPKAIMVCALSFAGTTSYAQKGFDFGLKGNIQTSSLLNATDQAAGPELDYKNKVGVAMGISGGYSFNEHTGLELNILYSKQGQGYIGDASQIAPSSYSGVLRLSDEFQAVPTTPLTGNYTARIDLTCIKIPILFRYNGNSTKKWYFSSFIGPQIDMLSSAVTQVNGQTADFTPFGLKTEDMYKKMTIDAVLGVGVGINLSKNIVLGIHLRLDYGLGDAENKDASINLVGASSKLYNGDRAATHNATGGGLISLNYKLVKKAKTTTTTTKTITTSKSKK